MAYERLTKRLCGVVTVKNEYGSDMSFLNKEANQVAERLAELEDDLASGKIVRLPCKIGDTVYYVLDYGSVIGECLSVEKGTVTAIEIRESYNCMWFEVSYDGFVSKHPLWNIGETVFFTPEEAEAAKAKLSKFKGV